MKNKNYYNTYSDNTFCKYFPNMMRDNMNDYKLNFITVTFQNQFRKVNTDEYKSYFKSVYQKINQYTVNNHSYNKHLKCKMVLVPEHSHESQKSNLIKPWHYHGFLMVHKEVNSKFRKNCINHYYDEYSEHYDYEDNNNIKYKAMLNPKLFHQRRQTGLKTHSVDFQLIGNKPNTVFKVCKYITKNLGNSYDKRHGFDLSDVNAGNSSRDEQVNVSQDRENAFCYEDVLFFGDISQTDVTKYKPVHVNKTMKYPKISDELLPQTPFRQAMQKQQHRWLERFHEERKQIPLKF